MDATADRKDDQSQGLGFLWTSRYLSRLSDRRYDYGLIQVSIYLLVGKTEAVSHSQSTGSSGFTCLVGTVDDIYTLLLSAES